jgi:hypothetical protein
MGVEYGIGQLLVVSTKEYKDMGLLGLRDRCRSIGYLREFKIIPPHQQI